MRIVSLLSSATEIVYELGLQEQLVGISHECEYPPEALSLPRLSRSRFDPTGMTSREIDAAVRQSMREHGSVYEVDAARLAELSPELVLTQAVCEVCAVPTGSVEAAIRGLPQLPRIASLDAHSLPGIFATIQQVAEAAGEPARGGETVQRLQERLARVGSAVAGARRPRVLALDWLDPPFAPGHWIPEMIARAGGENLLGEAGAPSAEIGWEDLEGLEPDLLLLLPCGYDLAQAAADAHRQRFRLKQVAAGAIRSGRTWVGHGAYFSRSGPRVVSGIESLAAVLHPGRAPDATLAGRLQRLEL
jgi:iron complex transport system substrate-binding protein